MERRKSLRWPASWVPAAATSGEAPVPCVLTTIARGILPYVNLSLPNVAARRKTSGVARGLHLAQFLLQVPDLITEPGGKLELKLGGG